MAIRELKCISKAGRVAKKWEITGCNFYGIGHTYSRVPNNSQDLIGVWVRNFYDNLNVNDPIIVYFLTA